MAATVTKEQNDQPIVYMHVKKTKNGKKEEEEGAREKRGQRHFRIKYVMYIVEVIEKSSLYLHRIAHFFPFYLILYSFFLNIFIVLKFNVKL